jgi:hypothetical protein
MLSLLNPIRGLINEGEINIQEDFIKFKKENRI